MPDPTRPTPSAPGASSEDEADDGPHVPPRRVATADPDRLRRAQARMETHAPVHLHELAARAEVQVGPGASVARGALMVALSAEHTHFFPGFGLYLPLPGGAAVAARPAGETRVRVEVPRVYGRLGAASAEGLDLRASERVAAAVVGLAAEVLERPVEAVVTCSLPACGESLVAAVAVAAVQAIAEARGRAAGEGAFTRERRLRRAQQVCEAVTRRTFGTAACVAALDGRPPALLLVDADASTSRPVEALSRDEMVWGLVHLPGAAATVPAEGRLSEADLPEAGASEVRAERAVTDFYKLRTAQVQAASLLLRNSPLRVGTEPLRTLRDVEHRQLPEVLALLPEEQRPVVRHLLSEDRRVPRLLAALRRRDGQVLGATLLIADASLCDDWFGHDWGVRADAVDFVRAQGEGVEGIYGMRRIGLGDCVLVVGRPYLLPVFLDAVAERYAEAFGAPLHTLVL